MGILNTIKQKPDNQKRVISLVISLVLTIFIVGFWFSLSHKNDGNLGEVDDTSKLSSISPVQVIKDEFSKAFSSINKSTTNISSSSTIPIEIISDQPASSTETVSTSTSLDLSTTSNKIN
jgi:hypothetical protein